LEKLMRSLKEECLDRMILFGEASLRKATTEFLAHFHGERNHRGLDNRLIEGGEEISRVSGPIQCPIPPKQRIGCHNRSQSGKRLTA
jgi:hypothetical protein